MDEAVSDIHTFSDHPMDITIHEKSVADRLYEIVSKIPTCGCGMPAESYAFVRRILQASARGVITPQTIGMQNEDGAYYFCLYAVEKAGLIEHGTSVRIAFPTADGEFLSKNWDIIPDHLLDRWQEWICDLSNNWDITSKSFRDYESINDE